MRKVILPPFFVMLLGLSFFLFLEACKKDKDEDLPGSTMTNIQITLPAGASVDLSKTSAYSLSESFSVGSDGKATIAFNAGSYEVVFLYDENNKPIMAGIISDANKEISIATTAQALLYYGLGVVYSQTNTERITRINLIPTYPQFAEFKTKLEQLFVANPLMFATDAYKEAYIKAVSEIHHQPILNLIGKQIKVEDADETKSGMTVRAQSGSDENMEVLNKYARRGHAYMYKVAYRDNNNFPYTLLSEILNITPAEYNMAVKGAAGVAPEISGPQPLPLENYEKESTWKVRIVGVGGDEGDITMTDVERAKYEELCVDFFAADLLMPLILGNLNQTNQIYKVLPNNVEGVRAYINQVKALLKPATIDLVKNGDYVEAVQDFSDYALWDSQKRGEIYKTLLDGVRAVVGNDAEFQASSNIEQNQEQQQALIDILENGLLSYITNTNTNNQNSNPIDARFTAVNSCNAIEQWTVISKDNDVTITPKHSKTTKLTNHTLTASATGDLAAGESIQYVWSTPGEFGVFKPGNVTTTSPSTSTTVTYYGNDAPDEDNIETIYLTASITGPNGTRELGTDTAYVNVKSLSIVMKPSGAILSPKAGARSLTLKLLNADDTNPIIQGSGVQYKVEWSTDGNYGYLDGNTLTYVTPHNMVVYTATDEDVISATENITARVFFKLSSSPDWIFREEVKGTVRINNDPKKIIYYAPLTSYHHDRDPGGGLWHYSNCGVAIPPVADALTYSVTITLASGSTYSETWNASAPGWLRGYMYGIDPATTGTHYVGYGANWGSCVNNGCNHTIADCSGGDALITITLQ